VCDERYSMGFTQDIDCVISILLAVQVLTRFKTDDLDRYVNMQEKTLNGYSCSDIMNIVKFFGSVLAYVMATAGYGVHSLTRAREDSIVCVCIWLSRSWSVIFKAMQCYFTWLCKNDFSRHRRLIIVEESKTLFVTASQFLQFKLKACVHRY
jgi:hypothetical protein